MIKTDEDGNEDVWNASAVILDIDSGVHCFVNYVKRPQPVARDNNLRCELSVNVLS